jgi:hypothetical protein
MSVQIGRNGDQIARNRVHNARNADHLPPEPRSDSAGISVQIGAEQAALGVRFAEGSQAAEDRGRLDLFDVAGRRVRTLEPALSPGATGWEARWDCRDEYGERVASGAYFA